MNIILIILLVLVNIISAENCSDFKTCGDCMGSPKVCLWCSDETYKGTRCLKRGTVLHKTDCESFVDFELSSIKLIDNDISRNLVPQKMEAIIRPGEKVKFNFSYKPAKDFALDIYFLIDSSYTMKQHIDKIQKQAEEIKTTLTEITNNVRFGVGTFVEKFALPYGVPSSTNDNLFYNHLSLSEDIKTFRSVVQNITNTGNLDIPEAGFDALMQVMVCKEIGWRPEARQIIIFATDSTYHSAGDGKMVGAFKPNDAICRLTNNAYKKEAYLTYDYPSVNQINRVANEKGINILFAVVHEVMTVYVALSKHIKRSECVELSLTSNLAYMIKAQYMKLQQKMQIDYSSTMPNDIYKLYIDKGYDEPYSFGLKEKVEVNAELEVTKCSQKDNYNLVLGSKDLHDENLLIEIELKCKCPCESKDKVQNDSVHCIKEGTLECGICKCNKGRFGEKCECIGDKTTEEVMNLCKVKSNDTEVCSGRGICVCGECKNCPDNYDGKYCEYSSRDCPYYRDEPCGGKGKCQNKVCKCDKNWSGEDCSCPLDNASCIGPNSKVCSDNGNCICGECECTKRDKNGDVYRGKYCNYCDTCTLQRCKELENYVVCYYNKINETKSHDKTVKYCDEQQKHLTEYDVKILNKTEINLRMGNDTYVCKKMLDDNTSIIFKYKDNIENTLIFIQKEKEAAHSSNYWLPIVISIGSVILVGILTAIIWKVLVDIHDAKEYDKFANESAHKGYDVSLNPLYLSPATNINNPAYSNRLD